MLAADVCIGARPYRSGSTSGDRHRGAEFRLSLHDSLLPAY
jgi:hypothetical protein